jgi:hypothetical protein
MNFNSCFVGAVAVIDVQDVDDLLTWRPDAGRFGFRRLPLQIFEMKFPGWLRLFFRGKQTFWSNAHPAAPVRPILPHLLGSKPEPGALAGSVLGAPAYIAILFILFVIFLGVKIEGILIIIIFVVHFLAVFLLGASCSELCFRIKLHTLPFSLSIKVRPINRIFLFGMIQTGAQRILRLIFTILNVEGARRR